VPSSYDPAVPAPLVITLHGFMQWPAHQARITRWNDLADAHGFIAVYPAGTGFPRRWRAGGAEPSDVLFLADLIDRLQAEYAIDPARIYINGLSNGGGMSLALACALSERIAAFGSVAGAYQLPWEDCRPARPVPAIVFHGTSDPIVPYDGGPSERFDVPFPAIPAWVDELARRNRCAGAPIEWPVAEQVRGLRYTDCDAEVVFYTILGGGHAWPGGEPLPEWLTGHTTQEIDATQAIWAFFQAHPLADASGPG
jgi:polyhydroxybutyrate depolymerase